MLLEDVHAVLAPGELVCLLGPNGAGKSTLMRSLSGMQSPLAGRIVVDGEDLRALGPRRLARFLAVVLTDRIAGDAFTAYALVELGRYPYTDWSGRLSEADHEVVCRSIEAVGAMDLAGRLLGELSDGERQKVMIARALAQEPEVLILDEVTAFLDLPRRVEVMRILQRLAHRQGKAVLLSTHDLDLALRSADRLWLLPQGGPLHVGSAGELIASGVFERTFGPDVAGLVGAPLTPLRGGAR
jgi:iron complex transport system ATP-binding protein